MGEENKDHLLMKSVDCDDENLISSIIQRMIKLKKM